MQASWVERIQVQCEEQSVPFFFKQWGGVQKKRTGRLLRGRTYDALPGRSASGVPTAAVRASIGIELRRIAAPWSDHISSRNHVLVARLPGTVPQEFERSPSVQQDGIPENGP
jgi:hypothetical protein